jgi:hypothetical protein
MEQSGAQFEGWAVIELFGHQKEAGFVTTQYFGDKAMFQVDVPELPACEETITEPQWGDAGLMPVGTVVAKQAVPGRTRLVNPGAVYAMNPATEDAVRAAIANGRRREIRVVSMPGQARLEAVSAGDERADDCDDCDDGTDE